MTRSLFTGMKRDVIVMRVIDRILREAAPDWGEVAFDQERKRPVKDPPEPDTPSEESVIQALINYIIMGSMVGPKTAAALRDALAAGAYTDIIRAPDPGAQLYRGVRATQEKLDRWLGGAVWPSRAEWQSRDGSWTMKQLPGWSSVQSYTYDHDVARKKFARPAPRSLTDVPTIFHATAGDNPGLFFDISGLHELIDEEIPYSREREVIGLGDIKVHRIEWGPRWSEEQWGRHGRQFGKKKESWEDS